MSASLGRRWWQHAIKRSLHSNGSHWLYKDYLNTQDWVMSIRSCHALQTVRKTMSKKNRVHYDSRYGSRVDA